MTYMNVIMFKNCQLSLHDSISLAMTQCLPDHIYVCMDDIHNVIMSSAQFS